MLVKVKICGINSLAAQPDPLAAARRNVAALVQSAGAEP
jgi:hypothetical protein